MCFGINQNQYIKYDNNKQLAIIGIYEDRLAAEVECAKDYRRHILSSEFHKSVYPKPITVSDSPRFNFPPNPFDFSNQNNSFDFYGTRKLNKDPHDMDID
jgi:hypothetical protein